jgi:hypothetical protein
MRRLWFGPITVQGVRDVMGIAASVVFVNLYCCIGCIFHTIGEEAGPGICTLVAADGSRRICQFPLHFLLDVLEHKRDIAQRLDNSDSAAGSSYVPLQIQAALPHFRFFVKYLSLFLARNLMAEAPSRNALT